MLLSARMKEAEAENKQIEEESRAVDPERVRIYEIGFHFIPSLSEDEVAGEVAGIKKAIEDAGGMFITEGYPKMRNLEYTIEVPITMPKTRFDHALFGWIKFEADVEAPAAIKEALARNDNIIRMLIIKTVRENTLYGYKLKQKREGEEAEAREATSAPVEQKKVSDEEIDKSIEEIIV